MNNINPYNNNFISRSSSRQYYSSSSWELEEAFAEDGRRGGGVGGFVWPPRCYSCSFCKRDFRSAQALGGHMNVHRKEKANLKHKHQTHHRLTYNPTPPNNNNNSNNTLLVTTTTPLNNHKKKKEVNYLCDQSNFDPAAGFSCPSSSSLMPPAAALAVGGSQEISTSCDTKTSSCAYDESDLFVLPHHDDINHHVETNLVLGINNMDPCSNAAGCKRRKTINNHDKTAHLIMAARDNMMLDLELRLAR